MQDMLTFPAKEAEQIIAAHDGDVALLWLCLRRNPDTGVEDAAGMLCRTRAEIEAALEKLQRMGLAEPKAAAPAAASSAQTTATGREQLFLSRAAVTARIAPVVCVIRAGK